MLDAVALLSGSESASRRELQGLVTEARAGLAVHDREADPPPEPAVGDDPVSRAYALRGWVRREEAAALARVGDRLLELSQDVLRANAPGRDGVDPESAARELIRDAARFLLRAAALAQDPALRGRSS